MFHLLMRLEMFSTSGENWEIRGDFDANGSLRYLVGSVPSGKPKFWRISSLVKPQTFLKKTRDLLALIAKPEV